MAGIIAQLLRSVGVSAQPVSEYADIAGLAINLDARSLNLSNGDPVSLFVDSQSSWEFGPGGSSDGNRPTYRASAINGLPALEFDNQHYLESHDSGDLMRGKHGITCLVVSRVDTDSPSGVSDSNMLFAHCQAGGALQYWFNARQHSERKRWRTGGRNKVGLVAHRASGGDVPIGSPCVSGNRCSATGNWSDFWDSGQRKALITDLFEDAGPYPDQANQFSTLGANGSGGEPLVGLIGQVLVWDRVLSTSELRQASLLLAAAWGVPYATADLQRPFGTPDLSMWYRPKLLPGNVGSVVPVLPDHSGMGDDGVSDAMPTIAEIDGRRCLSFDGSQFVAFGDAAAVTCEHQRGHTAYVVARPASQSQTRSWYYRSAQASTAIRVSIRTISPGLLISSWRRLDSEGTKTTTSATTPAINQWQILSVHTDWYGGLQQLCLDGIVTVSGSDFDSTGLGGDRGQSTAPSTTVRLGANSSGGTGVIGQMGDVIEVRRYIEPGSPEDAAIISHLKQEWGIA